MRFAVRLKTSKIFLPAEIWLLYLAMLTFELLPFGANRHVHLFTALASHPVVCGSAQQRLAAHRLVAETCAPTINFTSNDALRPQSIYPPVIDNLVRDGIWENNASRCKARTLSESAANTAHQWLAMS